MKYTISTQKYTFLTLLVLGSLLQFSCSKNSGSPYINTGTTPTINVKLSTNASLGSILTDSAGRSLYFFSHDANGSSACTGGCLAAWPAFYISSFVVGQGLDTADFTTISRSDGSKQTAYKGWPLYYFAYDTQPGDLKGDGSDNVWFVAKPDYSVMLANVQLVGNDGIQYDSAYQPGQQVVQYLTDDRGITLYAYSADKYDTNNYTNSSFSNNAYWPIYQASAVNSVPSILNKSQFATISIYGKTQLSFRGWPLYYFGPDNNQRGSTKGVSVPSPGVWPIVNLNSATAP